MSYKCWQILGIYLTYLILICAISKANLREILGKSQVQYIWGISKTYLWHISVIFQGSLRQISGLKRHIEGVKFNADLRHIAGISQTLLIFFYCLCSTILYLFFKTKSYFTHLVVPRTCFANKQDFVIYVIWEFWVGVCCLDSIWLI